MQQLVRGCWFSDEGQPHLWDPLKSARSVRKQGEDADHLGGD